MEKKITITRWFIVIKLINLDDPKNPILVVGQNYYPSRGVAELNMHLKCNEWENKRYGVIDSMVVKKTFSL